MPSVVSPFSIQVFIACQIALILSDNQGGILAETTHLVRSEDWEISDGAQKCHGISQQDCELFGLRADLMMKSYYAMASKAQTIVAHGSNFDKGMMEIETAYYKGERTAEELKATIKPWYCTQENSKDICKIPPTDKMKKAGRYHHKTPSLAEAYHCLTGNHIEGAHDAMVDARACKDVFFALKVLNS